MKKFLEIAFSKNLLPFSLAIVLLVVDILYLLLLQYVIIYAGNGLWGLIDFFIFLVALVLFSWMCINVLVSLVEKDWKNCLLRAGIVMLAYSILVPTAGVNIATVINMPSSPDDFLGKDIIIPADMVVNEPSASNSGSVQRPPLINELMRSWSQSPGYEAYSKAYNTNNYKEDVEVKVNNVFLPDLYSEKEIFLSHFATDAKWKVQKKGNGWVVNSIFIENLDQHNGEGSIQIYIGALPSQKRNYYKSKDGEIAITAVVWPSGIKTNPTFTSGNTHYAINERAYTDKRNFTDKALKLLSREFSVIRNSKMLKEQGFEPSIIASGSMKEGKEELELRDCPGAGSYCLDAFINPGEWGYVYLKAFEATSNRPLSEAELRNRTSEYIGWSSNPEEKFAYNTDVLIDEGGSRYRFPSRFEIWFHPENPSHRDRKLLEKTYWIHGIDPSND